MGGLGPGIGGSEWFIIGLVALLVVGPERLPGLLRQLGKMVAKARGMANEFRSSFDEMARQSELDDLRKEVEALRTGQSPVRLGAEADAAFKDIKDELNKPLIPPMTPAPSEWPDGEPVMMPVSPPPLVEAAVEPAPVEPVAKHTPKPRTAKPKTAPAKSGPAKARVAKPKAAAKTASKAAGTKTAPAKSRAPRNSKLDL